jgi:hypothetical protein
MGWTLELPDAVRKSKGLDTEEIDMIILFADLGVTSIATLSGWRVMRIGRISHSTPKNKF